jgi:hypothetical protein
MIAPRGSNAAACRATLVSVLQPFQVTAFSSDLHQILEVEQTSRPEAADPRRISTGGRSRAVGIAGASICRMLRLPLRRRYSSRRAFAHAS